MPALFGAGAFAGVTSASRRPLPALAGAGPRCSWAGGCSSSLAGAFARSSSNVGAALAPGLGGAAIDGGLGYRSPVCSSTLPATSALAAPGGARQGGRGNPRDGPAMAHSGERATAVT
ncbi:hypothetical protein AB0L59_23415 [Streptomyces sp. NPDC052109]|uniref:hypothetical protein n=1 Tax=Streptomyces sp. NPDC052109 TaxID=3155527 RepID=UPI0034278BA9